MAAGRAHVFIGPSGTPPYPEHIRLMYHPPAARGDILRCLDSDPVAIGLVDGFFGQRPAVLHKELLEALDRGISVLGAGSMGALRAAELAPYGMEGVGDIYARYASNDLTGDDEVAVVHAPPELRYKLLSIPLVELRFTLEKAVRGGLVTVEKAGSLIEVMRRLPFLQRTEDRLAEAMGVLDEGTSKRLGDFLKQHWVHQKRRDAEALICRLVRLLDAGSSPGPTRRAATTTLVAYHKLYYRDHRHGSGDVPVTDLQLLLVARLMVPESIEVHVETMVDVLLGQFAEDEGVSERPLEMGVDDCRNRGITLDDFEHLAALRRKAAGLREWWHEVHANARPGTLERAVLSLRTGGPAPAGLDALKSVEPDFWCTPPQRILDLRTPEGGLPESLLVTALKLSDAGPLAYRAAVDARRLNESAKRQHYDIHPGRLEKAWVLDDFAREHGLGPSALNRFHRNRGFAHLGQFVQALQFTFFLRRKAGKSAAKEGGADE